MTGAFGTILRGCKWLVSHWYIPLFAIAAAVAWVIRARDDGPVEAVRDELRAADQRERIKRLAIEKGAELANAVATSEYFDTIKALNAEQARKAEALRRNPVRRLRYLRRLSKRLSRQPARTPNHDP